MSIRSRAAVLVPSVALGALLAGCAAKAPGAKGDGGPGGDGGFCTAGQTQSCICLGGSTGIQTCRATGQSYGPCIDCGDSGMTMSSDLAVTQGSACGDCDGCCNGSTCVLAAAEDNTQCGMRNACAPCNGSDTCTNGVCVPAGTMSCTNCAFGVLCNNGTCTTNIDPNAMFKMYVKEVVFAQTLNGGEWDPDCGPPDPYVCISFTANGTTQNGCNQYCNDTFDCTPASGANLVGNSSGADPASSPLYIPGSVIINGGLSITAWDYDDIGSDDEAGNGNFPATQMYVKPYMTGAFGSVINLTFELD